LAEFVNSGLLQLQKKMIGRVCQSGVVQWISLKINRFGGFSTAYAQQSGHFLFYFAQWMWLSIGRMFSWSAAPPGLKN